MKLISPTNSGRCSVAITRSSLDTLALPDNIKKMLQEQVNPVDLEKYIQFSEKISFKFNPIAFSQDISDFFHFSGQLVDVEITENSCLRGQISCVTPRLFKYTTDRVFKKSRHSWELKKESL